MAKRAVKTAQSVEASNTGDTLSLDLGNAYSNAQGDNGLALDWRSIQAPLSASNKIADWPIADVIEFNGQWWAVGDPCYTLAPDNIQENPTTNRYISEWYKRLFAFALHKAFYKRVGEGVLYPRIITSIPASLFKSQDETAAVKANLVGDYEIGNVFRGDLIINVSPLHVVIVPEGIGTYFQYVFGAGNNSAYQAGTWMIADGGYLTLDCVMVRGGDYIADAAQSDERAGMSIVAAELKEYIRSKTRASLDRAEIDKAMECDTITANGKTVNIVQARTDMIERVAQRATLKLEEWAAGKNLSGILLTGGGAKYLHPHIVSNNLPPISLVPNARRSNVNGAYLYAVNT